MENEISKKEKEEKKDDMNEDSFTESVRKALGFKKKITLPQFPINKKIQKKYFKELPFMVKERNQESKKYKGDKLKEIITEIKYKSGIIKIITKSNGIEIINEKVDYSNLKPNYINNIKENLNKELELLVENAFLLYNRREVIRNIVQKPISTKILEEKLLLWKFYVKDLSKEETANLIRKLLYYIDKFSKKCYKEFLKIKEVSNAYFLLILHKKINTNQTFMNKEDEIYHLINKFYMMNSMIGSDEEGNPIKKSSFAEEASILLMMQENVLNIKDELNGTGLSFIFLKELKEIGDMYFNSSVIFENIFSECRNIFENKTFGMDKIEIFRILWNYFSNYSIEDKFILTFLIELKYLFGVYEQYDIIKFINRLVLVKYNTFETLNKIKKQLLDLIGPEKEEDLDEKIKIDKMENIDDIVKYIEGEKKPKKKKKKKKNKNNQIDDILNKYEDNNNIDSEKDDNDFTKDMDDGISIISEADSVLDIFKNDIIAETEFNTGNKISLSLSKEFLNKLP